MVREELEETKHPVEAIVAPPIEAMSSVEPLVADPTASETVETVAMTVVVEEVAVEEVALAVLPTGESVVAIEPAGLVEEVAMASQMDAERELAVDHDGEGEILVEEMTPIEALGEVEHVDLAPPTISEIVLIGARETEESDEEIDEEPASLASLAALAAVANEIASDMVPEVAIAISEGAVVPPAPDDPFTVLVCRLSDVAVSAGAPHVAAILPSLLFEGRLPEALEVEALNALREGGVVVANEISPTFVSRTNAWREILRGTSDDFEAVGNVMLDEWAADFLARLLSAPQRATSLRQELRTRGVAAFGLVEAA